MPMNGSAKAASTPVDHAEAFGVLGYEPKPAWTESRLVNQGTYWVTSDGRILRVADMPAGYAANAAALLLDRADGITVNTEAVFSEGAERIVLGKQAVLDSPLYAALIERSGRPEG